MPIPAKSAELEHIYKIWFFKDLPLCKKCMARGHSRPCGAAGTWAPPAAPSALCGGACRLDKTRPGGVYAPDFQPLDNRDMSGDPLTHPYRSHTCGDLQARARRPNRPAVRLGAPETGPRQPAVRRRPGSFRPDPVRDRILQRPLRGRRNGAPGKRRDGERKRGPALRRHHQSQPAHRARRGANPGIHGRIAGRRAAHPGGRRGGVSGRPQAQIPVSRSPPGSGRGRTSCSAAG